MNYHRFFEENFSMVKDLDVRSMENRLQYPRDEILSSFIVYISLCKLMAAQNLKGTLPTQRRFLEMLKRGIRHQPGGGLTFDQLRNLFPELRYENREIISKIFNSSIKAPSQEGTFNLDQYLKCAGILKSGTYEQKVGVLIDVIDYQGKGFLTWRDLKNLCKQSFSLCVDAEITGLATNDERTTKPLFTAETRKYVRNTEGGTFNSDVVEEEMSTFFADLMFERVNGKAGDTPGTHKK